LDSQSFDVRTQRREADLILVDGTIGVVIQHILHPTESRLKILHGYAWQRVQELLKNRDASEHPYVSGVDWAERASLIDQLFPSQQFCPGFVHAKR